MKKVLLAAPVLAVTLGLAGPVAASDDSCTFSTPDVASPECSVDVQPVTLEPTETQTVSAPDLPTTPDAQTQPGARTQLPVTGVETATMAAFGLAMVGGGAMLVARSRRGEPVDA